MDRVFTAIERVAQPKRGISADFAAAPAMISDGEVSDRRLIGSSMRWRYFRVQHEVTVKCNRQPQYPTALTNDTDKPIRFFICAVESL
jgi:hypothetical protein